MVKAPLLAEIVSLGEISQFLSKLVEVTLNLNQTKHGFLRTVTNLL